MNRLSSLTGLQLESEFVQTDSANFVPDTWPPRRDFPVVVDGNDKVVSRFGDPSWDIGPWLGRAMRLTFGDGQTTGGVVDSRNADIFRLVAGWWLWGPQAVRRITTLRQRYLKLKPVFVACSESGVLASELYRYPKVIERVAMRLGPSNGHEALSLLNYLWLQRNELGLTILDEAGLRTLSGLIQERNSTQTAYIPPRIWTYQTERLRECLDDFSAHRSQVEACYRSCLNAYAAAADGSLAGAFRERAAKRKARKQLITPFNPWSPVYKGTFVDMAAEFGLHDLFDRWIDTNPVNGVRQLSTYLTLISSVGLAYILTFSLMRYAEAESLCAGCYEIERDPVGEDICLLRGRTTKTIEDDDACWIVSPSVQVAVDCMTSVANLRIEAGRHDEDVKLSKEELRRPHLQAPAYEPWGSTLHKRNYKGKQVSYGAIQDLWPKLFDVDQLRITEDDLAVAQRMTLGLDPDVFAIGKVWPLAWHQMRRTGAVNMLASGYVSDASLQYQLKHATRAMSRYYGQNYYHLQHTLDDETRGLYLKEMYQQLAREFTELGDDRFVSPHGGKRKDQILAPVVEKDHKGLLADGKAGRISYRETLFGGCTLLGDPCRLGGVSNISGCMGHGSEKPCDQVLIDRAKRPVIVAVRDIAVASKAAAPADSALAESLQAQIESAERALNVIDNS